MALKAVQVSSSLGRRNSYLCSASSSAHHNRVPVKLNAVRVDARIATKKHKKCASVLKCRANLQGCLNEAAQPQQDQLTEIPLVAYPFVLFPGATLQLQMFEFRHRIMMHTLLEQGLRFGIIYSNKSSGMADVGCIAHVVEHERLVDDRFFLTCIGGDRFQVIDVVRTKPYVIAKIQVLNDCPSVDSDLECLAQEVEDHMKTVTRLSNRLNWKPRRDQTELVEGSHSPASFSFFVARLFVVDVAEQQQLLRLDDATQRLIRGRDYLVHRCKYLAALTAIKGAFAHLSFNEK